MNKAFAVLLALSLLLMAVSTLADEQAEALTVTFDMNTTPDNRFLL